MYSLNDPNGDIIFEFRDETIYDHNNKIIGYIRNGVVCDDGGNPTRATAEGENVKFDGSVVASLARTITVDGTVSAVVVGPASEKQCMLAAVAYWEFVESQT